MNASRELPKNFSSLLRANINKRIYICCCSGRAAYCGNLKSVDNTTVGIFERDKASTFGIKISDIYCISEDMKENNFGESPEETQLFQKYSSLLGRQVEVKRAKKGFWAAEGELKYIAEDYLIVLDHIDNAVLYIFAPEEVEMSVFGFCVNINK